MSGITVRGSGAVSPAGWGVAALMAALDRGEMAGLAEIERVTAAGRTVVSRVARVPAAVGNVLPKSPRLRRVSPIGKFAAAAALEALGEEGFAAVNAGGVRLGVICTLMNGCVNYSNRFFGEVLKEPAMASPILFPETVYNAPSSHLSAMTGSTGPNDTLVGDGSAFFTGLELAAEWLLRGDCDWCLLVSPEEVDWLSAEALALCSKGAVASEGAAAVLLERDGAGPVLLGVPDPVSYAEVMDRVAALEKLRLALGAEDDGATLLADGRSGAWRCDRAEDEVFADWSGPRISTRKRLGEALGASAGLQVVAALEYLKAGRVERAVVTAVGGNQQVAGCWLGRSGL